MIAHTLYPQDVRVRRAAEALRLAGYAVDVYCVRSSTRSDFAFQMIGGVRVIRFPLERHWHRGKLRYLLEYASFGLMALGAVAAHHLVRRYDLIYVHTLPDVLVFAASVPKLLGASVLLDLHDPMPETMISKFGLSEGHPLVRLTKFLEHVSLLYADQAITVHEPLRQLFLQRRVPPDKIAVVMNLVDQSRFPRRARLPEANRGRFVLVYAGLVSARYGLDLALYAMALLRQDIPDIYLRIIGPGDGDQLAQLRRLVGELGIEALVEFIPLVSHQEVWRLLQDADVGISAHRPDPLFRLSLSNKVYEYVAVGLPAIVPRTETLCMYYPEDVVRFFTPGDPEDLAQAILHLYRSPDERWLRVQKGWALIERWNWATERARLVSIVDGLCRRTR
jgi:glycosyltransferase involved in cell wall biosynthesis